MKPTPPRCLLCEGRWTDAQPYLSRGLHRGCYHRMWHAGRLDEFPKLLYALPRKPQAPKVAVGCHGAPDCENRSKPMSPTNPGASTYRCAPCQYLERTTGGYDRRLLSRYDVSLPLLDRVLYWLDPDTRQPLRGVPTPFVQPGGPEGDCLIWQRLLGGNSWQHASKNLYAKVHHNGKQERAHRLVYSVIYRAPLDELLVVDHSCEETACINPAHLEAETLAGNTAGRLKTLRLERRWNDPDALRARLAELEEAA